MSEQEEYLEIIPEWYWCNDHGRTVVVDSETTDGFTGAPIYWFVLQCGCHALDDDTYDNLGWVE